MPIVKTGLERIADKSQRDTNFQFNSLAHHVTEEMLWRNLCVTPKSSARGVDKQSVKEAKNTFNDWAHGMINSIHRKSYKTPAVKRVYIPKPGKKEKRPIGVPTVSDRALQRSVTEVLSAIYENDFLDCSFGGRPGRGAHNALCTFHEIVSGRKISYVYECDLKNFFGSLNHGWVERFVEHRVGDPRILKLIRGWLRAGVMENGTVKASEMGTPQGGSISVLLSNIYLHYVLDLWFERVVKPRLKGEAYLIRYIDDFMVCFQYAADANRFARVLTKRLSRFSLEIEPSKTKLVSFGRYARRWAKINGLKLETVYFLGFTHYCTRNRRGNFAVGRKTENSRQKRFLVRLRALMYALRHKPLAEQWAAVNMRLQGYYAYYGVGGNLKMLRVTHRIVEKLWRKVLSSRSQRSNVTWDKYQSILRTHPIRRPRLYIPYSRMSSLAVLPTGH